MVFVNSVSSSILGLLAVQQIIITTIQLLITLFEIYITIKIFDKAKQPLWLAIIPVVNKATLLKIANMSPLWVIVWIISILCGFLELAFLEGIMSIISVILFVIIMNIKLAKAFDLSIWFAIGMMIFPIIFYAIIAFGDFRYTGTKEQKEAAADVFKLNGNKNKDYIPRSDFFRD